MLRPTLGLRSFSEAGSLAPDIIEAILRGDEPDGLSRAPSKGTCSCYVASYYAA